MGAVRRRDHGGSLPASVRSGRPGTSVHTVLAAALVLRLLELAVGEALTRTLTLASTAEKEGHDSQTKLRRPIGKPYSLTTFAISTPTPCDLGTRQRRLLFWW